METLLYWNRGKLKNFDQPPDFTLYAAIFRNSAHQVFQAVAKISLTQQSDLAFL